MFNLKNAIIPTPAKISGGDSFVKIGEMSKSNFRFENMADGICAKSGAKKIADAFAGFAMESSSDADFAIILKTDENDIHFDSSHTDEAYFITIDEKGATLVGKGDAGAFYAAVSFSKLLHTDGSDVCLPVCEIFDFPVLKRRGHFVECRWGSDFLTLDHWKRIIDEYSDMKINTVVVGVYGCWSVQYDNTPSQYQYIPFKKHPELITPRSTKYYSAKDKKMHTQIKVLPRIYEDDYIGELIAYGKTKNVHVFPLFNSLGHNTLIPTKHPEITIVDENGKRTGKLFCLSDPKTYELLFELYDEIIDRYLTPNGIDSFAIGLDEVNGYDCHCNGCKGRDFGELMIEYIIAIAKHMKQKGIKNLYVYHDMLFSHDKLTEETVERFKKEGVWDIIVIDWWSYNNGDRFFDGNSGKINNLFRSIGKPISGYYFWCMPSHSNENVELMAKLAKEKGFEGMIAYTAYDDTYDFNFKVYAQNAWSPESKNQYEMLRQYAELEFPGLDGAYDVLKDVLECMETYYDNSHLCIQYLNFYFTSYFNKTEYPQNYPAKRYAMMKEEEEKFLSYTDNIIPKARRAYEFFDKNCVSKSADIWKLTGMAYLAHCDVYASMYRADKAYNEGRLDIKDYLCEIDRLIAQFERYMAICEDVRIEANKYITLRNISIERQFLLDIKNYIEKELEKGNKPELVLSECKPLLSAASWYLR